MTIFVQSKMNGHIQQLQMSTHTKLQCFSSPYKRRRPNNWWSNSNICKRVQGDYSSTHQQIGNKTCKIPKRHHACPEKSYDGGSILEGHHWTRVQAHKKWAEPQQQSLCVENCKRAQRCKSKHEHPENQQCRLIDPATRMCRSEERKQSQNAKAK